MDRVLPAFGISLILLAGIEAASAHVLLERTTTSGFVLPQAAMTMSCTVSNTGEVTLEFQSGDIGSASTRTVQFTKTEVEKAITEAAQGNVVKEEPQMIDAGAITYTAYQRQADGSTKEIPLWQTKDLAFHNDAPSAERLKNLLDFLCGH